MIPALQSVKVSFGKSSERKDNTQNTDTTQGKTYDNPIKSGFEYLDATKAAIIGGFCLAGRFLIESDIWADTSGLLIEKCQNKPNWGKSALVWGGAIFLGLSGLLALGLMPKYLYEKKKELFVKKREVDSFVRVNSAGVQIYDQLATKAKDATPEEKQHLYRQLMLMNTANAGNKFPVKA